MLDHLATTRAERARLQTTLAEAMGASDRPTNGRQANAAALAEAIAWDGTRVRALASLLDLADRLEELRDEQIGPRTPAAYDFDALAELVGARDTARLILGFLGAFPNDGTRYWSEGPGSTPVDVSSLFLV